MSDYDETIRATFEHWWNRNFAPDAIRNEDGSYTRDAINHAWLAWQACAALGITPHDHKTKASK